MEKNFTTVDFRKYKDLMVREERMAVTKRQLKRMVNMSRWKMDDLEFYQDFFKGLKL
jgi:hypothetical protein